MSLPCSLVQQHSGHPEVSQGCVLTDGMWVMVTVQLLHLPLPWSCLHKESLQAQRLAACSASHVSEQQLNVLHGVHPLHCCQQAPCAALCLPCSTGLVTLLHCPGVSTCPCSGVTRSCSCWQAQHWMGWQRMTGGQQRHWLAGWLAGWWLCGWGVGACVSG